MSFFDNVKNLDEIPDDPFGIPDGTYKIRVIEATHNPTKNDQNKFGLLLKYQVIEGPYSNAFPFTEWLHTPGQNDDPSDVNIMRSYANLKKHFLAFGFGADELHLASPETLIEREAMVKIRTVQDKNDPSRKQIRIQDIYSADTQGFEEFTNDHNTATDF